MKNILYWVIIYTTLCFSCTSPVENYVVEGEIKGFGDGPMYVMFETLDNYATDTVFVTNDRFVYRSATKHPVQLIFMPIDNEPCTQHATYGFKVFVENSNTPIQVSAEVEKKIENAIITGSKLQQELEQIEATGILKRIGHLQRELKGLPEGDTLEIKTKEFKQAVKEGLDELFALDFAKSSVAAVFAIAQNFSFLSVDELEMVLERFDEQNLEPSVYMEKMQERIRRTRQMAIGNKAPDFKLEDINGKQYQLADFAGKMVLLDFTASWCHWCKVEIPFIKQVYEQMKGKDFEIISVYLDKKREDWVKDVEASGHPWKCLSDVKSWNKGGMAYDYNVGGIPNLLLLDKDGKILCRGMRGEETLKKVEEYYKK